MIRMVDAIDASAGDLFTDIKKDRGGPSLGQCWTFLAKTYFKTTTAKRTIQKRLVEGEVDGCGKILVRARRFCFQYNRAMANLTLVYGMRLLPADELAGVEDATIQLKNGKTARVTMHVLEGSKEDIEKQLRASTEAFFDFYPEI